MDPESAHEAEHRRAEADAARTARLEKHAAGREMSKPGGRKDEDESEAGGRKV